MGIRDLRKEKNITQEELSILTGISRRTIDRVENGRGKDLRLSSFVLLANAFDISLDNLYKEYLDSEPANNSFLKKIRENRSLTQEEIGKEIGISKNAVWKIEKYGVDRCLDSTKEKIANYLDISVKELIEKDFQ